MTTPRKPRSRELLVWLAVFVVTLVLGVLAGCASGEQTWRDLYAGATGPLRGDAQFYADAAQCDYEWRQASAGAPVRPYYNNAQTGVGQALGDLGGAFMQGAPVQLYYACMRARGWERLQ